MSAPARGAGASRARSSTPPSVRGRGGRGASRAYQPRGRGGRETAPTTNPRAEGLLQGLQAGNLNKRGNAPTRAARGRGTTARGTAISTRGQLANNTKTFAAMKSIPAAPKTPDATPTGSDYMAQATARFESLKRNRESERSRAIKDGFLADPDKKTTLDNAITPVGTCTDMCPAFERVERIVQRMVDKSEKDQSDSTRPDENRMVKRFRRSAAGYDEQLPSDIRTPATLKRTLDYLLDDIIGGGERLASIHKFVWDRTRGIRNDFSIQQVTKKEDVKLAVECLERIARFHILSLHQLSNPENLVGEQFDAHQDREQLNNTLLSLMYYYDDNRHVLEFPNEAEFRAYCIIFELQSQHPDLEDRMQSWPETLLQDGRIKTAFKLYAAAGNNLFDQGPLRPLTPFSIAQANTGSFWSILASKQVSYLMACVAEIYFGQVRYVALQALWSAATSAPASQRAKNQEWTLEELANVLGFDAEEQATEFCEAFGLEISSKEDGTQFLDVSQNKTLDKSSIPTKQEFSYGIVEAKRYRRTLTAIINGKTIAQAIREGLVEADEDQAGGTEEPETADDGGSLFFPEQKADSANPFAKSTISDANPFAKSAATLFNPQASSFQPGIFQQAQAQSTIQPQVSANPFAKAVNGFPPTTTMGQPSTSLFTQSPATFPTSQTKVDSPKTAAKSANPFSNSSGFSFTPQSTPPKPASQPFIFNSGGFPGTMASAPLINPAPPIPPTTANPFSIFNSQPISPPIAQTPAPPATFSFPTTEQENTQSTVGHPTNVPEFHPWPKFSSLGASTLPPGTIASQQEFQPASPPLKKPEPPLSLDPVLQELTPDPVSPEQQLNDARSFAPVKFSTAPNGPVAAFDQPARTWPRQFPRHSVLQSTSPPQSAASPPSNKPGASSNPMVVNPPQNDSGSTQPATTQSQPPTSSSGATPDFEPIPPPPECNQQSSSDPKVPTEIRPVTFESQPASTDTSHRSQLLPSPPSRVAKKPPAPKPRKLPTPAERKEQIVNSIAHIAMTSTTKKNFLQEFVELTTVGLINEAIQQHLDEVHAAEAEFERAAEINRINNSNNRRERRRADFADIERKYEEKERKRIEESAERDAIVAEMEESAKLSAQVIANLAKEQEREKKKEKEQKAKEAKEPKAKANAAKGLVAGRKRKSDASDTTDEPRFDLAGRPYTPLHKRSRTEPIIDAELDSDDEGYEQHKVRYRNMPKIAGRSIFSRNVSNYGVRLASDPRCRKIDNTKTDYFRLKARGVDPETPIIPLTEAQVEYRRQQEALRKAQLAAEPKPWQGNRTMDREKNGYPPVDALPKIQNFQMPTSKAASSSPLPVAKPQQPKATKDSINDLLRQLDRAKKEQEAGTNWLKAQIGQLQQELGGGNGNAVRAGTSRDDAIELDSD